MIIDSHCHLDFDVLNKKLDRVIKDANDVGVKTFLTICTNNKSFIKILSILEKYSNVYGTYGIHPHETKDYEDLSLENIKTNLSKNPKIIGVGESGLDFFYNHSKTEIQKKIFIKHINASQETSKPIVVHTRNAENETYEILKSEIKNKNFKILMHCFTGTKEFAKKLLDIGSYFSASGIITFKKNYELVETFKYIPTERILVETDSPYLSPEPLRGKTNEPKNIIYTTKFLSVVKKVDENSFNKFTTNNFINLFNLNPSI